MRKSQAILMAVCFLALIGASGCEQIMSLITANREAGKWDGPIKEIAFEEISKDGKVFTIEMRSRIVAPIDKVWAALKQPEKLADNSEQYKRSDLIKEDGNAKEIDINVMALGNLQNFKMRLTFDEAKHVVKIETLQSTLADISGTYSLEASPDGTQTLYTYKAKQTDKVALPISEGVQRSAIKESFVNQVRAMKKQMGLSS